MTASMPTAAEMEQDRSAYDRARVALKGLKRTAKQDKTFAAWADICTALATAQQETFRVTGSNQNQGRVYAEAFNLILKREGLDDQDWLNKPTRACLFGACAISRADPGVEGCVEPCASRRDEPPADGHQELEGELCSGAQAEAGRRCGGRRSRQW